MFCGCARCLYVCCGRVYIFFPVSFKTLWTRTWQFGRARGNLVRCERVFVFFCSSFQSFNPLLWASTLAAAVRVGVSNSCCVLAIYSGCTNQPSRITDITVASLCSQKLSCRCVCAIAGGVAFPATAADTPRPRSLRYEPFVVSNAHSVSIVLGGSPKRSFGRPSDHLGQASDRMGDRACGVKQPLPPPCRVVGHQHSALCDFKRMLEIMSPMGLGGPVKLLCHIFLTVSHDCSHGVCRFASNQTTNNKQQTTNNKQQKTNKQQIMTNGKQRISKLEGKLTRVCT
jgi:hypothetical protein